MDSASIALSGMNAAATGMAVTSNNVANVNSKDYKAKRLDLENLEPQGGVKPQALQESQAPTVPNGSNVDLATEFTSLLSQSDAYKANTKVLQVQQELLGTVLDMKA